MTEKVVTAQIVRRPLDQAPASHDTASCPFATGAKVVEQFPSWHGARVQLCFADGIMELSFWPRRRWEDADHPQAL